MTTPREEGTILAPVDKVANPGHAVRESGPHRLIERGRLEAALEEAWVLADDLVAGVSRHPLEAGLT